MIAKHGFERLILQAMFVRIAPRKNRVIGYVDETHCATWVQLTSRAHCLRLPVREGQLLSMPSCTGIGAIHRHALVIKQIPAEPRLGNGHWVVGGYTRFGESFRQVPSIFAGLGILARLGSSQSDCDECSKRRKQD